MRFDTFQQKCVCIDGFAFGAGNQCQQCQHNYFALNGFCVTCPSFSFLGTNNCLCQEGYLQMPDGSCRPKCLDLEVYNVATAQCECMIGLARINGICSLCPRNTYL